MILPLLVHGGDAEGDAEAVPLTRPSYLPAGVLYNGEENGQGGQLRKWETTAASKKYGKSRHAYQSLLCSL